MVIGSSSGWSASITTMAVISFVSEAIGSTYWVFFSEHLAAVAIDHEHRTGAQVERIGDPMKADRVTKR